MAKEKQPELKAETQDLISFMQTLIDAGMSLDYVRSFGFEWAGNISLGRDKYDHAARELLAAAMFLKIDRKSQELASKQSGGTSA